MISSVDGFSSSSTASNLETIRRCAKNNINKQQSYNEVSLTSIYNNDYTTSIRSYNNVKQSTILYAKKKSPSSSDDDSSSGNNSSSSLYYHSNDESHKSIKKLDQDHMYKSLDYRHRGKLQLEQGTLMAYRFIRNHFLIPNDIENNEKFGPHSGQCFEERVIRAYTLGQLKAKKEYKGESLLVCSYCGDEGHKRDACLKLL